jgi:hypothetical protein
MENSMILESFYIRKINRDIRDEKEKRYRVA